MRLWTEEQGTTLIEVIAAVTLLTVALIPLLGSIASTNTAMINSGKKTQAAYLAQQTLENLKAGKTEEISDKLSKMYQTEVSKSLVPGTTNLYEVEVTVKWGNNQQVNLVTHMIGE